MNSNINQSLQGIHLYQRSLDKSNSIKAFHPVPTLDRSLCGERDQISIWLNHVTVKLIQSNCDNSSQHAVEFNSDTNSIRFQIEDAQHKNVKD